MQRYEGLDFVSKKLLLCMGYWIPTSSLALTVSSDIQLSQHVSVFSVFTQDILCPLNGPLC